MRHFRSRRIRVLDGDRAEVWKALRRIEEDDRHAKLVIVEAGEVAARVFGNWWMGFATRSEVTDIAPFLRNGLLCPHDMNAKDMLALVTAVGSSEQVGMWLPLPSSGQQPIRRAATTISIRY